MIGFHDYLFLQYKGKGLVSNAKKSHAGKNADKNLIFSFFKRNNCDLIGLN